LALGDLGRRAYAAVLDRLPDPMAGTVQDAIAAGRAARTRDDIRLGVALADFRVRRALPGGGVGLVCVGASHATHEQVRNTVAALPWASRALVLCVTDAEDPAPFVMAGVTVELVPTREAWAQATGQDPSGYEAFRDARVAEVTGSRGCMLIVTDEDVDDLPWLVEAALAAATARNRSAKSRLDSPPPEA
jgi:hypothetical protein